MGDRAPDILYYSVRRTALADQRDGIIVGSVGCDELDDPFHVDNDSGRWSDDYDSA